MNYSKAIAILVAAASLAAICPRAEAQDNAASVATARLLYDDARDLMKAGRYNEACPKLEQSNSLSPTTDTKFWLADCYEHTARTARAWQLFRDAADESKSQGNQKKATFARERAQLLVSRLAKIKVSVPAEAAVSGLEIKRNGELLNKVLWDQEVPVDAGDYVITAEAPGKVTWEQPQKVDDGAVIVVTIPKLADVPKPVQVGPVGSVDPIPPPPKPGVEPGRVSWGLRGAAIGAGAVGAAGIVVGAVFGSRAMSQWSQVQTMCGADEAHCPNGSGAHDLSVEAGDNATASTIGFAVGGTALAAGVVLWILSRPHAPAKPSSGLLLTPSVSPDHAWMSVRANF